MHFLRELFKTFDQKKNYVLIMDNAAFQKTQCVKNLIAEYAPRIRVEHIPPYSPELNPIETCWKVTKNAVTNSQYFSKIEDLQDALETFWQKHVFTQNFIGYLCP